MGSLKRFFRVLGQTLDLNRPFDSEYFVPQEWKGMTAEQRAAHMIAAGFQEGIRQVKVRYPELSHVQETSITPINSQ